MVLAKQHTACAAATCSALGAQFIPFTAQTRMSGVDLRGPPDPQGRGRRHRRQWLAAAGRRAATASVQREVENVARAGRARRWWWPRARARSGVIELKDIVKGGIKERFAELRRMGIKTVMITGDNPLTAAAIAAEAGVDDFLAEATPEAKLKLIREHQQQGRLVAMTGDGTNDAPALAQADVAVAMNTGTQAAKEAGNMVDLDSNPTKLIEIVEIGKQTADDARRADHLQHRQRRRQVLRHHPGGLCQHLSAAQRAQHHASGQPAERDPLGGDLQRPDHHRADSAGAARRALSRRRRRRRCCSAIC